MLGSISRVFFRVIDDDLATVGVKRAENRIILVNTEVRLSS